MLTPIVVQKLTNKGFFRRYPWANAPIQTGLVGFILIFATPLGCAFFSQMASIKVIEHLHFIFERFLFSICVSNSKIGRWFGARSQRSCEEEESRSRSRLVQQGLVNKMILKSKFAPLAASRHTCILFAGQWTSTSLDNKLCLQFTESNNNKIISFTWKY